MIAHRARDLFRLHLWEALGLAAILLVALALRLAVSDHPIGLHGGDGYRDYLIADHALRYGEWPVVGPNNAFLPGLGNSPLYFYLVTLFALVWNDPAFVQLCFIAMYLASVACVFYIARILFDRAPGFIAAGIVAVAPMCVYDAAGFIWQPFAMEPFLTGAVLALVVGWKARSVRVLVASQALYLCAVAFHMSALGLLPVYGPILYVVTRRIGGRRGVIWLAAWGAGASLTIFGASVAMAIGKALSPGATIAGYREIGITAISAEKLRYFVDALTLRVFRPFEGAWPIVAIAAASVAYFKLLVAGRAERRALAAILLAVIVHASFSLAALVFMGEVGSRYLMPIGWALAVATGALVYALFLSRGRALQAAGTFVLAAMLWGYAQSDDMKVALANLGDFARPRSQAMDKATDAVVAEIERVRFDEGRSDYRFFDFDGYRAGDHGVTGTIFWQRLERRIGVPFVKVQGGMTSRINVPELMFVFCAKDSAIIGMYAEIDCLRAFGKKRPAYMVEREIYSDRYLSVFLASDPLLVGRK